MLDSRSLAGSDSIADRMVYNGDGLSHGDYKVTRRKKIVPQEGIDEVEVSYVLLQYKEKNVATFDGVYSGVGNGAAFGLFSLLGGNTQQLIVSLDVPRGEQGSDDLVLMPSLLRA